MTKFTRLMVNRERKRFQKESVWKKFKVGAVSIRLVIFSLIILVGFIYLIQINRVSTGGFKIKELTDRMENLRQENKKLELEVTKLQSLKNVEEASKELNLVGVSKIDYLITPPSSVALSE